MVALSVIFVYNDSDRTFMVKEEYEVSLSYATHYEETDF